MRLNVLAILALALVSAGAQAQISSVGPFAGAISESFESMDHYAVTGGLSSLSAFGGAGTFTSSNPQLYVYHTSNATWGLGAYGSAPAQDGVQGLGLYNSLDPVSVTLTFASEVSQFGGWMATDSNANLMTVTFFDANNVQIGATQNVGHGSNAMVWYGWSSTVGIKSVMFGNDLAPAMDALQANPVPEPASMAVLGLGLAALARRRRK